MIAIGAIFVVIESVVNIPLLMNALPNAALGAVLLAILVSLINVGGLGIAAGLLYSWIRRQPSTSNLMSRMYFASWLVIAMGFNFIAGRHRQAYSEVVDVIRRGSDSVPPSPQDLLSSVSYNPLTWEFQALLFALLGMILCAAGFAKGFFFVRSKETNRDADAEKSWENDETRTGPPFSVIKAYEDVLNQFRFGVGRLRVDVADWYASLDQKRREMHDTVNVLTEEKNRLACIACVSHAFITAYNNAHAAKIDLAKVEEHRKQKYTDPILVTPSDTEVLEEAAVLADEWQKSGQESLERRITDAQEKMMALWAQYEPLVLGSGQSGKLLTYGLTTISAPADSMDLENRSNKEEVAAREG